LFGAQNLGSCLGEITVRWDNKDWRINGNTLPNHYASITALNYVHPDDDPYLSLICKLRSISYTCPTSHPTKLNNSTCEYRENF